jgi:hypothetical protein
MEASGGFSVGARTMFLNRFRRKSQQLTRKKAKGKGKRKAESHFLIKKRPALNKTLVEKLQPLPVP